MVARRTFLAGALAAPFAARAAEERWDAVVDPLTGTLGAALARAEAADGAPFRILVKPGVLTEKLTIRAPNLTIAGSPGSVLQFGTSSGTAKPGGGTWGTSGSAVLTVSAPGLTLRGLTIRNSYDYIGARRDKSGNGAQAVALLIGREADRTHVDRCALLGYQDTLYVNARARFDACRVVGGVDFIFGGGAAWFDRCRIVTRYVPGSEGSGFLTAPSTPLAQKYGLVFDRCRIERERGVPNHSAWLGRPWRAGGNMDLTGQSVFLRCWMDAHIRREGWTWMGFLGPGGEQRRLTPPEARLFEFGSTGPGAGPAGPDRRFLTAAEATEFTPAAVLGGWAP